MITMLTLLTLIHGHVRVYEEINGVWSQIGGDIDGAYNENIGRSVALNDDGNIVAVS